MTRQASMVTPISRGKKETRMDSVLPVITLLISSGAGIRTRPRASSPTAHRWDRQGRRYPGQRTFREILAPKDNFPGSPNPFSAKS